MSSQLTAARPGVAIRGQNPLSLILPDNFRVALNLDGTIRNGYTLRIRIVSEPRPGSLRLVHRDRRGPPICPLCGTIALHTQPCRLRTPVG